MSTKSVFEKIIDREITADIVYEDERCIAIHDINPKAPLHLLIIPKKKIRTFSEIESTDWELIANLFKCAQDLAAKHHAKDYRLQINNGEKAGQTVFHLHLHLLAWPNLEK